MHPLKAKREQLWANWKDGELSQEEFKRELYQLCLGKYQSFTSLNTTVSQ